MPATLRTGFAGNAELSRVEDNQNEDEGAGMRKLPVINICTLPLVFSYLQYKDLFSRS
jgi:hypothetical protein